MNHQLSIEELRYYSRQIRLKQIGISGQLKFKQASVLVIGVGGLGCPALMYLASAGVGHIGLLDNDIVSLSNLHRQSLFQYADLGRLKVDCAAEKLQSSNPFIQIEKYPIYFNADCAHILKQYDVIVDATDNFSSKYLLNDLCQQLYKPLIYASIDQFSGQLAVFKNKEFHKSANLRHIFPTQPPDHLVMSCNTAGVLGVLPGILGTYQAAEALKLILNINEPENKLYLFDVLGNKLRSINIDTHSEIQSQHPILQQSGVCQNINIANQITACTLKTWLIEARKFYLIDIREQDEYDELAFTAATFIHDIDSEALIHKDIHPIVLYCSTGKRSINQFEYFRLIFPNHPIYMLKDGLFGYLDEGYSFGIGGHAILSEDTMLKIKKRSGKFLRLATSKNL